MYKCGITMFACIYVCIHVRPTFDRRTEQENSVGHCTGTYQLRASAQIESLCRRYTFHNGVWPFLYQAQAVALVKAYQYVHRILHDPAGKSRSHKLQHATYDVKRALGHIGAGLRCIQFHRSFKKRP